MENSPNGQPIHPEPPAIERTTFYGGDVPQSQDADESFKADLSFLEPTGAPGSLGRLGHYDILQFLGRGAFGVVFRAFDTVLERVVAVKVLDPKMAATSPARKRFLREARTAAQICHENVVQIHAVEEQPLPYLVMEFVQGETLQQQLDRTGPLGKMEVVAIGRQAAEGLAAAHAAGLIHRDIKPANILIECGPRLRLKITDFGLARAADDASLTQSGVVAGTPMYMSPEQAEGNTLDHRTDLFSLGSVLYQMTAGRPPFRASSALAVLKRVAEDTPRPIREIIPEAPQWLCDVISKLHAKSLDDRFQSARELADLLTDCETKLKSNQDVTGLYPPVKPAGSRWRKWMAFGVVLSLLALTLLESVGVTHVFRKQREPNPTVKQGMPEAQGWMQLFNGSDLAGWKTHPDQPGNWRVEKGVLVGSGPRSHLFSERGDYRNFHVRIEAKVNDNGDGGLYFRSEFGAGKASKTSGLKYPNGYEAQILGGRVTNDPPTGSLVGGASPVRGPSSINSPDAWLTLEVIARGNRLEIRVNNETTVDVRDDSGTFREGHFALQCGGAGRSTTIQVRKIEIQELPSS